MRMHTAPMTGAAVRELRTHAGLTLLDVAAQTSRSESRLSRFERGQVTVGDDFLADVLACIARALTGHKLPPSPAAGSKERGRPSSPVESAALPLPPGE
jgi:transcriptional regulator with XRE-family HTH domain